MANTSKIRKILVTGFLSLGVILSYQPAISAVKGGDGGDARIKTLIYNDSEVFRISMRNGFQTDIQLNPDESIDTMSIGDSIGWQLTPASHRIFIKPLQKTGTTNLSVITNKRNYQFELIATNPTTPRADNAYVVKFYYPDSDSNVSAPIDRTRGSMRPVSQTAIPEPMVEMPAPPIPARTITPPVLPGDVAAPPMPPQAAAPTMPEPMPVTPPTMPGDMTAPPVAIPLPPEGYNFNYTLSGPEENAPIKVFDDGRSTFFQFKSQPSPALNFARIMPDGTEVALPARLDADNKMIIDQLGNKFTIRDGSSLICVFNEARP